MPKIIGNLRERLLSEARRQTAESGYGALTMRNIAQACGVGVGTVYNYFSSKELLIASFMAEDWAEATEQMRRAETEGSAKGILLAEYDGLMRFLQQHETLFSDPAAIKTFTSLPRSRHFQLRDQLAAPIERALMREGRANAPFLASFLAEALLTWTMEGVERDVLMQVLLPLLTAP